MTDTPLQPVALRTQLAVYSLGLCTQGTTALMGVLMPLWVITLSPSPLMIGITLSASTFLPLFLAIHAGALMDRLGARGILIGLAVIMTAIPILIPISPWIPAVIAFQMIYGFAQTMGWVGAQAMIGELMGGDPTYAGRLSFTLRIGTMSAPPLAGAIWDFFGPGGAFAFAACWGVVMLIAAIMLPSRERAPDSDPPDHIELADAVPRWRDYADAFALMALPVVTMIVLVSTVRIVANHIQSTFFVVYLEGIGLSGTLIGLLITAAAGCGMVGALSAGPIARRFNPMLTMITVTAISTALMCITPLLAFYFLLVIASGFRGIALGIGQPLMISILAKGCRREDQGKAAALRATINRGAQTLLPVIMGGIAEVAGIENSFLIVGAGLLILLAIITACGKRIPGALG